MKLKQLNINVKKFITSAVLFIASVASTQCLAEYLQGCDDPEYQRYIDQRFEYFESRNRRLLNDTLRDYQLSLSTSTSVFQVLTTLSRHIKYSAQFEPIEVVQSKIAQAFDHAEQMSREEQIAGEVYDGFSSENHNVDIARAWIAYRQGDLNRAFEKLNSSIDGVDSPLLSAFGPDFDLVRYLYRDGHIEPVVSYLKKTDVFWTGERPKALRTAWFNMIDAGCKIQFDAIDVIKVEELGLDTVNLQEALGLD